LCSGNLVHILLSAVRLQLLSVFYRQIAMTTEQYAYTTTNNIR